MPVFETFSKRRKRLSKQGMEVYQYEDLPETFRVQVIHILNDIIGTPYEDYEQGYEEWKAIHDVLARERGVFQLADARLPWRRCQNFLLATDTDGALDFIEISFLLLSKRYDRGDEAIQELNHRFREHGIGYQFEGRELVRVDSQYLHAEAVKPAIALLNDHGFKGASEEFLNAHEHYRKGETKEAINWALKAFESTMKTICEARKWSYAPGATAKPLLDILFEKGLVPQEMQSHFQALRSTLEAGLPTLRNKSSSSHGQGPTPREVPDYMAAYALHLAATNIVFLVEAHKATT